MLGHRCSRVEEHGLFVSAVVRIKRRCFPASWRLLFLSPSMPSPPEQQAPLASSAFRLDCPTHSAPPQSIKMRRCVLLSAVHAPLYDGEQSEACFVTGACI